MRVTMRYFAGIREALGRAREERTVLPDTTVGALMAQIASEEPVLAGARRSLMVMVNQEYAGDEQGLADGDEVALIPPVSGGGAGSIGPFRVQAAPLDPGAVEAVVATDGAGAIVTFIGTVRDQARGRAVVALEYEAYPEAAEKMLRRLGEEIEERWGIDRVAIVHRTGRLAVGEASVVIAVASPHRGEAFAACQYAIDRLKQIVPIWKKEEYGDGTAWIGSEADYQRENGRASLVESVRPSPASEPI